MPRFRLPNLLRRVLGEGGLNPAVVPTLARLPPAKARLFAGEALNTAAFALLAPTALVEIAAGVSHSFSRRALPEIPKPSPSRALHPPVFPLVFGVALASVRRRGASSSAALRSPTAIAPLVVNAWLDRHASHPRISAGGNAAEPQGRLACRLVEPCRTSCSSASSVSPSPVTRCRSGSRGRAWSPDMRRSSTALLTVAAKPRCSFSSSSATQAASFRPRWSPGSTTRTGWSSFRSASLRRASASCSCLNSPRATSRERRRPSIAAQNAGPRASAAVALPAAVALAVSRRDRSRACSSSGVRSAPQTPQGTAMAMAGLASALPFAVAAKVFSHTLFARSALRHRSSPSSRASSQPCRGSPPHPSGGARSASAFARLHRLHAQALVLQARSGARACGGRHRAPLRAAIRVAPLRRHPRRQPLLRPAALCRSVEPATLLALPCRRRRLYAAVGRRRRRRRPRRSRPFSRKTR